MSLPDPLALSGRFDVDPDNKTVIVRPAPDANARAKSLWWRGHQALRQAERSGRAADSVWANIPGRGQVAYALPGQETTLRFNLSPDDYRKLTTTPNLRVLCVVDKRSARILNVTFRGGR